MFIVCFHIYKCGLALQPHLTQVDSPKNEIKPFQWKYLLKLKQIWGGGGGRMTVL